MQFNADLDPLFNEKVKRVVVALHEISQIVRGSIEYEAIEARSMSLLQEIDRYRDRRRPSQRRPRRRW